MIHYLQQWMHAYFMHFGFWVSFGMGVTIYRRGLMPIRSLPAMLKSALVTSAILSVFSAQSQAHIMEFFLKHIGG